MKNIFEEALRDVSDLKRQAPNHLQEDLETIESALLLGQHIQTKSRRLVDLIYKGLLSKFQIAVAIQEVIGEPDEYASKHYSEAFEEQIKELEDEEN